MAQRGLQFDAVVIGGAALRVLGIITRGTRDCDVLAPPLPDAIRVAADEFAAEQRAAGVALRDGWLNDGPSSLCTELPAGWEGNLQPLLAGRALTLRTLGRLGLLRSKLYALCDRSVDWDDCMALRPTSDELAVIEPWLTGRDANPDWPEHVREVVDAVAGALGLTLGRGRGGHVL